MESKKAGVLEERAKRYFDERTGPVLDKNGEPLSGSSGEALMQYTKPLTVTGLALALGFCSREELYAVKDKKSAEVIARALLEIEAFAEEKLFNKESFTGTKLFLSVNFPRWRKEAAAEAEGFPEEFESWVK